jgi:hypothetical protein
MTRGEFRELEPPLTGSAGMQIGLLGRGVSKSDGGEDDSLAGSVGFNIGDCSRMPVLSPAVGESGRAPSLVGNPVKREPMKLRPLKLAENVQEKESYLKKCNNVKRFKREPRKLTPLQKCDGKKGRVDRQFRHALYNTLASGY